MSSQIITLSPADLLWRDYCSVGGCQGRATQVLTLKPYSRACGVCGGEVALCDSHLQEALADMASICSKELSS